MMKAVCARITVVGKNMKGSSLELGSSLNSYQPTFGWCGGSPISCVLIVLSRGCNAPDLPAARGTGAETECNTNTTLRRPVP